MKKRLYQTTKLLLLISLCCTFFVLNVYASGGMFYKTDNRGINFQYVPCTSSSNGWSDKTTVYGGESVELKLGINRGTLQDADALTVHFLSGDLVNMDESDKAIITVENAHILTADGSEIAIDEFNGKYERSSENQGNQICNSSDISWLAEELTDAFFCASVSVSFTESEAVKISDYATINGTVPADYFYNVEDHKIVLVDFVADGMNIHGGDNHEAIVLVLKGDCQIGELNINCPVTIQRQAYASLVGTSCTVGDFGSITFDLEYNATVSNIQNGSYSIAFDSSKNEASMTQGEKDELNRTYDFDWRHRTATWYQTAVNNIENNRKESVTICLTNENGDAINDATISIKLEDYDYIFSAQSAGAYYYNNEYWTSYKHFPSNVYIDYSAFAWECFDNTYDGDEANTYSFEKSNYGNTNYIRDMVCESKKYGVNVYAQQLVYPAIRRMDYNTVSAEVTDEISAYILSDEYTATGFDQYIKDHIKERVTAYAGVVDTWAVVNEVYYYNDFFKLIYGTDGTGISKEDIANVLTNGVNNGTLSVTATNSEKIKCLESYLDTLDRVDEKEVAKIVAGWAEAAQEAWDTSITDGCGYSSDDLTLYINDCIYPIENGSDEHYVYAQNVNAELSKATNYPSEKVLITFFGSEMASGWNEPPHTNPEEVLKMLDDTAVAGMDTCITEFNYWLDNPVSDTSAIENYGINYKTTGFSSQAEKEFAYDYAYYILTAAYSHPSSCGFVSTTYPHGQIGFTYHNQELSPMGEAYLDLVMDEWNTECETTISNGQGMTETPLSYGLYSAQIIVGDLSFEETFIITEGTDKIALKVPVSHSMTKTEAKEVSCNKEGSREYFSCSICGKYFSDEAGTTEIVKDSWIIPATGEHTYKDGACDVCNTPQLEQADFGFAQSSMIKVYGDAAFSVSATGAVSGSSVSYTSSNPAVATVDNTGKVTILKAGSTTITATASEAGDYAEAKDTLSLTVNKSSNTPNMPSDTMSVESDVATAGAISLPADWKWENANTALTEGGTTKVTAVYNGADKGNYVTEKVVVSITRAKAVIYYTIQFHANGGSGSMSALSNRVYGTSYRLTANAYTRAGYVFTGWNTKADGSGTAYKDGASVKNLSSTNGSKVTLYAQWAPIKPHKITNVVSGVHVYWTAVSGAQKYGLWRSENGVNGTYKWIANPTVAHFTDTKVESGKTYYYKVTVLNTSTNRHSPMSEAIGVTFVSTPDITLRVNRGAGIGLTWQKVTGATGYAIYRKPYSGNSDWVRITTITNPNTLSWNDTSVRNQNGSIYKYTIRALAGSNRTILSGCRPAGRTMVRLSSRTMSSAAKAGTTSIKCSWNTTSQATGYEVRFMVGSEVYKTYTIGNYKTGTRTFTGLKAGQTYKIQVRTYKRVEGVGSFYSAWSAEKYVSL